MSLSTKNLQEIFGNKIKFNEKLSKYNWFNSGGPAELFYKADNQVELASFLKHIKSFNKTINIIGAGSNTIIRDGGIKGVTIKLSSKFSYTNLLEENIIEAGGWKPNLEKRLSSLSR